MSAIKIESVSAISSQMCDTGMIWVMETNRWIFSSHTHKNQSINQCQTYITQYKIQ